MTDQIGFDPGELFLAVEKPSRYTGGEVNARRTGDDACRLRVVLAFPDAYEVGMSHLGLQILYSVLNDLPHLCCERCYAPWPDMEALLRKRRFPLRSLESQRPLAGFDIVGFSLQYELSYTNVLMMLELGGIPLRRGERNERHPLIIAGGPSSFNPAPMSAFIDAFVIGEGEEAVGEIAASVMAVRGMGGKRHEQIEALAGGDFIRRRSNWILVGQSGVGKSFLLQAVGRSACAHGCRVRYVTSAALLVDLAASLAVIHFIWQTKADFRQPLVYGAVVVVLLAVRLPHVRKTVSLLRGR